MNDVIIAAVRPLPLAPNLGVTVFGDQRISRSVITRIRGSSKFAGLG
jgi:hypothetical protein